MLTTVALREGEHGKAFAKRMCELGFSLVPKSDGKGAQRAKIAGSKKLTDLEKFQQLDLGVPPVDGKPDIFAGMFADSTIDIQTGALLGRYIAEERDSGRLFQQCRALLEAECANGATGRAVGNGHRNGASSSNGASGERLDRIEALLECLVEKLDA